MSKGWIKLDRQMTEHWLWKDKPFSYAQAWVDLLLKANHKSAKILIKNCLVELKRGDQARSERTLEKDWGWSRGKVRRFLVLLKNDGMIVQRAVPVTSIITICNYESFQGDSTTCSTSNSTSLDTTGEPQAVHKQECKNEKKEDITQSTPVKKVDKVPYMKILDLYHEHTNYSRVRVFGDDKKAKIRKVWNTKDLNNEYPYRDSGWWIAWFQWAATSPMMDGTNGGWTANFDFLITLTKIHKAENGDYDKVFSNGNS